MQNINAVTITGNLTRDPELRHTQAGKPVCNLGVAVNGRRKNAHDEWVDKPNFLNVTVWGGQGESCAERLEKGRPVAISGRLDWKKVTSKDGDREYITIVADTVQFLYPKAGDGETASEEPEEAEGGELVGVGASDDDIPF